MVINCWSIKLEICSDYNLPDTSYQVIALEKKKGMHLDHLMVPGEEYEDGADSSRSGNTLSCKVTQS